MPTVHLTDAVVRDLAAPSTRTDYFDDIVTGLCLRVTPRGHRSWSVLYRAAGRQRRLTLKPYPTLLLADARKAAREALRGVSIGRNPQQDKAEAKHARTFDDLADLYIERYAKPRKRSWMVDARQLRVFCRPRWGTWPAAGITRAQVRDLLVDVRADRSGVIANRLQACLSKLFSWAVSEGYVEDHPVRGLTKSAEEKARDRVLTDDELARVWQELKAAEQRWVTTPKELARPHNALSPDVAFWLRLRLLTAQRGGEVADLRWADVDLSRAQWEIPASRYKNGRPHVCPLPPWALALLAARRAARPHDTYVCEGGRGLAARSGVGHAFTVENFHAHDLRRTAATRMAQAGVTAFVVARVLGHTDRSVTGIYNRHDYLGDKLHALTLWQQHVATVVGETRWQAPTTVARARRGRA